MGRVPLLTAVALLLAGPRAVQAQRAPTAYPAGVAVPSPCLPASGPAHAGACAEVQNGDPHPAIPSAASLVVPGAGQWLLGQRRWAGYILLETLAWVAYLDRRRSGGRLGEEYRTLAWDVARSGFGGVRVDGDFEYYEDVANFTNSGRFDVDPLMEGIQPETDITTFNGQVWDLARGLFFPVDQPNPVPGSPAHEQALSFYLSNGYADAFLWNWDTNALERRRFRLLISESDEALRRATLMLGVIGVNHLLSAVDGLISARLRAAGRGTIETSFLPALRGGGWGFSVRWTH